MKYTRGPWKWDEQNNWVRLGNGCVIPFAKDTKADGILVAAAPDMYEALKAIKEFMAEGGLLGNQDKPYSMLLEALALTEGRTAQ